MAKIKKLFRCGECQAEFPRWQGQCNTCKEWNAIEEVKDFANSSSKVKEADIISHNGYAGITEFTEIQKLSDVQIDNLSKTKTGFSELDSVMSGGEEGGAITGSVTLIGGDPGIGKSTLLIQTVGNMSDLGNKKVLYVSGEESLSQIKLRAVRLKLAVEKINVLSETNIERILEKCNTFKPDVLIVDSIQTMFTSTSTSKPGSTSQLRDVATILTRYSKGQNMTSFIIGHVTKGGDIAGPKVLEHIVDTVLYFEGEKDSKYRILRSIKNRFGEVNEIAVFSMEEVGLVEETNPSAIFLNKDSEESHSGSVIVIAREGSKNLLIEVQALVSETSAEMVQRRTIGLDRDRIPMIIATMQKRLHLKLWKSDVFASAVSGMKLVEPAVDVPIALAILSSNYDKALPRDLAAFGEIGLAGEVRQVLSGEERIKEAIKQGMKRFIIPKGNKPITPKLLKEIKKNDVQIDLISSLEDLEAIYHSFK